MKTPISVKLGGAIIMISSIALMLYYIWHGTQDSDFASKLYITSLIFGAVIMPVSDIIKPSKK